MVSIEDFYELFIHELNSANPGKSMLAYYKFLLSERNWYYRKSQFCRRLRFIMKHIGKTSNEIWDCGCGFGTTSIFLALNGYKVYGNTLEKQYIELLPERLDYWKQFGDMENFTYSYGDIFDRGRQSTGFARVILQDTLHHLEPIHEALGILYDALKENGKLIAIEENGANPLREIRLFLRRGNKRIITIYDQYLKKNITLGNENIRSLKEWGRLFKCNKLNIVDVQYSGFLLPPIVKWDEQNTKKLEKFEDSISESFLNKLFFSLNFLAEKNSNKKADCFACSEDRYKTYLPPLHPID
jgi:SAM-dependent methyltransferase